MIDRVWAWLSSYIQQDTDANMRVNISADILPRMAYRCNEIDEGRHTWDVDMLRMRWNEISVLCCTGGNGRTYLKNHR